MNRNRSTLLMLCLLIAGCGDSQLWKWQNRFILDQEPKGEVTVVSRIRSALQKDDAPAEMDVVVRGRVYAGEDSSPWVEGKARFILADFSGHDGNSEHNPFTCPYCSESIEDYRVFVTFRDSEGKVIEIDARELFGLKEMQRVTVNGIASLNGDDVYLDASGVFIEK